MVHACDPSGRELETGKSLGLTDQAAWPILWANVLKSKVKGT